MRLNAAKLRLFPPNRFSSDWARSPDERPVP
jgi:hypothetical protein